MSRSDDLVTIYVDVINGYQKKYSRVKLTPELEKEWDEIAQWCKDQKAANPDVVFEVPSEIPNAYEPVIKAEKSTDRDEIRTFIKFIAKSPKREFEFSAVPELYAEVLNKFVAAKDFDSARRYAERYLQ